MGECNQRTLGRRPGCAEDTQADIDAIVVDIDAIKAVTDVLPDAGALTSISAETDKIAAIKAVTDALPDAGALTSISDETDKIDGAATLGLDGTPDSLAYRMAKLEEAQFTWERWLGLATAPAGETHRADRMGTTTLPFIMDGGNNTWGTWLQVIGSSDTPITGGQTKFGLRRVLLTVIERKSSTHLIQIGCGESGAAALAAGTYTELVFRPASVQARATPIELLVTRQNVGTKAWARCWAIGADTGTIAFWLGLREYEG